jgi:hypothetical protein
MPICVLLKTFLIPSSVDRTMTPFEWIDLAVTFSLDRLDLESSFCYPDAPRS